MNAPIRSDLDRLAGLGLRIEHRSVEALIPYARNARTHSDAQVALIAGSIWLVGAVVVGLAAQDRGRRDGAVGHQRSPA